MNAADWLSTGAADTSVLHQFVASLRVGPGTPASRRGGIVWPPAEAAASRASPVRAKNVAPRVNEFMRGSSGSIMRRLSPAEHLTDGTTDGRAGFLSFFGTHEQSRGGPGRRTLT